MKPRQNSARGAAMQGALGKSRAQHVAVSGGPQYRPQNTLVPIMTTPNFGHPPCESKVLDVGNENKNPLGPRTQVIGF